MHRVTIREEERDRYRIKEVSCFKSFNLGENKTFNDIKNKFVNYRFTEWIDEMRYKHNCRSSSSIIFKLKFRKELIITRFLLFILEMDIFGDGEVDFKIMNTDFEDYFRYEANKIFNEKEYDDVYVKAVMSTTYDLLSPLVNEYEQEQIEDLHDEGDDEDLTPVIIESCFMSDNCTICLSSPPNILFTPCLHFAVCERCEKNGKLIICSVCRETIERKIKI